MKVTSNIIGNWKNSLFTIKPFILCILPPSFFSFSPLLQQQLSFYWACFQFKNFWECIIEMVKFYHRIARSNHRKFCCEIFTHISEHFRTYLRLHWASHLDLGITGKLFSSCRTQGRMMPILVKRDVSNGRNVNSCDGWFQPAQELMGQMYSCLRFSKSPISYM